MEVNLQSTVYIKLHIKAIKYTTLYSSSSYQHKVSTILLINDSICSDFHLLNN